MKTIETKHGYILPVTEFDSSKPFTVEDRDKVIYAVERGLPICDIKNEPIL